MEPRSTTHLVLTSVTLGIMILATIVGNSFVIAAILLERNLRHIGNYLIASLAVADLLVATLVMPLALVKEVSTRWFLGPIVCDVWISFDVLCCTSSILHLVAISLDRYWAVNRVEYIHNRSAKRIGALIAASWGLSAIISIPPLFTEMEQRWGNHSHIDDCIISQNWGYTVFSTVGAFYIPLLFMIIIYLSIYRTAQMRIRKKQFIKSCRIRNTAPYNAVRAAGDNQIIHTTIPVKNQENFHQDHQNFHQDQGSSNQEKGNSHQDNGDFHQEKGNFHQLESTDLILPHSKSEDNKLYSNKSSNENNEDKDLSEYADTDISKLALQDNVNNDSEPTKSDEDEKNSINNIQKTHGKTHSGISLPLLNSSYVNNQEAAPTPTSQNGVDKSHTETTHTPDTLNDLPLTSESTLGVSGSRGTLPTPSSIKGSWLDLSKFHWEQKTPRPPEVKARQKLEKKRERKAARTLAVVTGSFIICWLPFFIVALVRPFCGDRCYYPPLLMSIIGWLGFFNSLLNPVIYTVFNPDFRKAFGKILLGSYRKHNAMNFR